MALEQVFDSPGAPRLSPTAHNKRSNPPADLSKRQWLTCRTLRFAPYGNVGHVFQGRYKAILVQKENHLLEVCRYVVLNPVRVGAVKTPEAWE